MTGMMLLRPARTLRRPVGGGFLVVDASRLASTSSAILPPLTDVLMTNCGVAYTLRRGGLRAVFAGAGVKVSSSSDCSMFTSTLFSSSDESTIVLRCAPRRGRVGETCDIFTRRWPVSTRCRDAKEATTAEGTQESSLKVDCYPLFTTNPGLATPRLRRVTCKTLIWT